MLLRKCQKCGQELGLDKFSPNRERKDGICVWCKECNRRGMQEWRAKKRKTGELKVCRKKYYAKEYTGKNKKKRIETQKKRYHKNKKEWIPWFVEIYGAHPVCQVCGKMLKWRIPGGEEVEKRDMVCFDHRHEGNEEIQRSPSLYAAETIFREKTRKKWLSCDFGILCHACNGCLPTKGRTEWLEAALKYHNSMNRSESV